MQTNKTRFLSFDFLLSVLYFLLIFSLGFMQPFVRLSNFDLPLTDFIFLIIFPLWGLAALLKKTNFRLSSFYLPLAFYFIALIFSTIFSANPKISFFKFLGETYLIGLAILTFNLVCSVKMAKITVIVWLIATFIACLVNIITLILFYTDNTNSLLLYTLSHYGTLPPGNYPRIRGTFQNANMLCNYLNVGLMFALAALRLKWIERSIFVVFIFIYAIAAFFTLSPGLGGIALCMGLWSYIVSAEKKQFLFARFSLFSGISIAILFFLMLLILPNENPLSPYRFNLPFFQKPIYPSERLLAWQSALQTLWENPFFGRGVGMEVANVHSIIASGQVHFVGDAHQVWLNVAGQMGIVGLAAIIFLSIFFFGKIKPFTLQNSPFSTLRICFGIAFLGAFLYQGLGGSFEDARHLWVLIGLLGSLSYNHQSFANTS